MMQKQPLLKINDNANQTLEPYYFTIPNTYKGMRIDSVLSDIIPDLSRNRITNWLKNASILVNGQIVKPKTKVEGGEEIYVTPTLNEEELAFTPENIDLNVIYQDEQIIVINKPAGLVVHPGSGNWHGTLLNGLLYHFKELTLIPRAGIVHRLDKDTSGLMVVARTLLAQTKLVKQLQDHSVSRVYRAIVEGHTQENGSIDKNMGRSLKNRIQMSVIDIGGKEAITHFKTLEYFDDFSYIECRLETGRTHQIRVHMKYSGHPLVGDPLYGTKKTNYPQNIVDAIHKLNRQALHAIRLSFIHPKTNDPIGFKVPLAKDFKYLLDQLSNSPKDHDDEFDSTFDEKCKVIYAAE